MCPPNYLIVWNKLVGTAATMVRIFFLGPNSDFLLERGPNLCKSQNFQLNTRMNLQILIETGYYNLIQYPIEKH